MLLGRAFEQALGPHFRREDSGAFFSRMVHPSPLAKIRACSLRIVTARIACSSKKSCCSPASAMRTVRTIPKRSTTPESPHGSPE